jgi:hypothetical protein
VGSQSGVVDPYTVPGNTSSKESQESNSPIRAERSNNDSEITSSRKPIGKESAGAKK